MSNFPYETISSFFEDQGDFEENLEHTHDPEDEGVQIDVVDHFGEEDDPRDAEIAPYVNPASGEIDPEHPEVSWFVNECGDTYPYPAHLQEEHYPNDFHVAYGTEGEAALASEAEGDTEPCCYNSTRNHGTGEHEYDCPVEIKFRAERA